MTTPPADRPSGAPFALATFLSGLVAVGATSIVGVLTGHWDPLLVALIAYAVGFVLALFLDGHRAART